jgi:hypothetical protein
MKPKGIRRVLIGFGALVAWAGLWASPAQAAFRCQSYNVHSCDDYSCWIQHSSYCFDTVTGDIYSEVWGDPDCWDKFP